MLPRPATATAMFAMACFGGALLLAQAGVPGFSHRLHPLALRGVPGLPWALAFNWFAFVLPGALLAWTGWRLRGALEDAAWSGRVGAVLAQLSALAFAAQGLLPMEPDDLDSQASRMHALAWMLWWIAFVPGALLLAAGARRVPRIAVACLAAALLVPALALFAPAWLAPGLAQRLAFAAWFGWWIAICASASAPGSSTKAGR